MIMRNGNWKDDEAEEEEAKEAKEAKEAAAMIIEGKEIESKVEAADNNIISSSKKTNFKQLFHTEHMRQQLLSKENDQCEGTPAYLPPETMSIDGKIHSEGQDPKADAWAIGCVAYFCYHGRPRFFGEVIQVMEQMEMWFDECDQTTDNNAAAGEAHHVQFHSHHDSNSSPVASVLLGNSIERLQDIGCESFIRTLLCKDPRTRASAFAVLDHPYLVQGILTDSIILTPTEETPVVYHPRSLHQQTPPSWPQGDGQSSGDGTLDSRWARRQFSTLWAPMPPKYDLHQSATPTSPGATGRPTRTSYQDDLPYQLIRKPLPIVLETTEESGSHFVEIFTSSLIANSTGNAYLTSTRLHK